MSTEYKSIYFVTGEGRESKLMSVGNRTVLLAVLRPLLHFIRNKRSTVIRHLNTRLHICRSIARVDYKIGTKCGSN